MAVNSAKSRWNIDFCHYRNDVCPEMIQLTSFCIYKSMRIINSKYSCIFGLQESDWT